MSKMEKFEKLVMTITTEEHDRLFKEGSALIQPYIKLRGRPGLTRDKKSEDDINRGIKLLGKLTEVNPQNWSALWFIGKAYQVLGNSEKACSAFEKSFLIQKQNPDVAREYSFECLRLGRVQESVNAAEHAYNLDPKNAGLISNLALSYVMAGRNADALNLTEKAIAIAPTDKIAKNLNKLIQEIMSGVRKQPESLKDL